MEFIKILFPSLLSGIIGVLVGCWINNKLQVRREKREILRKLITYASIPTHPERVEAINMIPLIFSNDKEVCTCFEQFRKAQDEVTENIQNPNVFQKKWSEFSVAHIKLMESIIRVLNYNKTVSWDKLNNPYMPRYFIDSQQQMNWY